MIIEILLDLKRLKESLPIQIKSTFLGAHAIPKNYEKEDYFKLVINDNSINYSIIIFPAKKHISYLDIKTSFELFYDRISF